MKTHSNWRLLAVVLPAISLLSASSVALAADGFGGAIYTTGSDSLPVNQNQFATKADVYLNGGPHTNGSRLPDGTYYYQVTTPNGVLLSTDNAVCRQVVVFQGIMRADLPVVPDPGCTHSYGTPDPKGSVAVRLIPFDDTDNNGGVYKVWLIRQTSDTSIASDLIHINFKNSDTKTDNFKVLPTVVPPQSAIGGVKFLDANHNGVLDLPDEAPIPSTVQQFTIHVEYVLPAGGGSGSIDAQTDSAGNWALSFPAGTTYSACEVQEPGWTQTSPLNGAQTADQAATATGMCWTGTVLSTDTADLNFGNVHCNFNVTCPPAVTGACDTDIPVAATTAEEFIAQGGTITDDCDANPTVTFTDSVSGSGCKGDPKVITRTYVVTDSLGLTGTCDQTITIEDKIPPVIEPATAIAECLKSSAGNWIAITPPSASDNCGGTVTVTGTVLLPGSSTPVDLATLTDSDHPGQYLFPEGNSTITWNAVDRCLNNADPVDQTVTIKGAVVTATKFYDANTNGQNDDGILLANWPIKLTGTDFYGNGISMSGFTNGSGVVTFTSVPMSKTGTSYTIEEKMPLVVPPSNWVSSTGTSFTFSLTDCDATQDFAFGNYCIATPGGHTLGFWSNKNGQALETTGDFTALTGLNLRNADGSDRDFSGTLAQNKTALNSWLLNATATNMAYMLSAQLTATRLSVNHGFTNSSVVVDGTMTVADLIVYANELLSTSITVAPFVGQNGSVTVASSALRSEQERVKNILDKINNGGGFIQLLPCSYTFP